YLALAQEKIKEGYRAKLWANPTSRNFSKPTPDFSLTMEKDGVQQTWAIEVKQAGETFREDKLLGEGKVEAFTKGLSRGYAGKDNNYQPRFGDQIGHGLYQLSSQGSGVEKILEIHFERTPYLGSLKTLKESLQGFIDKNGLKVTVRFIYSEGTRDRRGGSEKRELKVEKVQPKGAVDNPHALSL
ncbi:MAG: hypothetical protein R3257_07965, partial [bacterium]|nr:hypothetical protein [bacterium]